MCVARVTVLSVCVCVLCLEVFVCVYLLGMEVVCQCLYECVRWGGRAFVLVTWHARICPFGLQLTPCQHARNCGRAATRRRH